MTNNTKMMHDTITNEISIVKLTDAEQAEKDIQDADFQQRQAAKQAEAEAKAQAKAIAEGKLAALGLTTDDLRALGL